MAGYPKEMINAFYDELHEVSAFVKHTGIDKETYIKAMKETIPKALNEHTEKCDEIVSKRSK